MPASHVSTEGRALLHDLHVNVSMREFEGAPARELIHSGYAELVTGKLFMTGAGRLAAAKLKRDGGARPSAKAAVFPGSREAFRMLQRLVGKGPMRNYNDALAEELTKRGFACVADGALIPTEEGRAAAARSAAPPL